MTLKKRDKIFYCISKYGEWQAKEAKFRWNPDKKEWWTDDPKKAYRLRSYADSVLQTELEQTIESLKQKEEDSIQASRATNAEIEIPAPEGLNYLPYQKAGIAYAMERGSTLIGDEMGLGKTIQAIGLINALKAKRVLVICPASLRLNWKRELEKWLTDRLFVGIATGQQFPFEQIRIINFDILHRHTDKIREIDWDLLIVDECHYLKNPKARRTKQVLGYGKDLKPIPAKKRLFLTGTPMVNRPIELHPILKSISYQDWGNWKQFITTYCAGYHNGYAWDVSGASNLEELQDRLRSTCMVRRLKKDVLKDLPAKRRQVIELPTNGTANVVKKEQKLSKKYNEQIAKAKLAVELAKASEDKADYDAAVEALREANQLKFTEMAAARKAVAVAKIPAVIERLQEVIDTGNKVVVFAHHHEVIDALVAALPSGQVVKLDGRDSMSQRDQAVQRFQEQDSVKVFVGGIKAAGVGLTLTAASHVIFAELDWVPGALSQAEDRCHRIGQTNSVLVQHLVIDGSIDATMAKTLVEKQSVLDRALDQHTDPKARASRQEQDLKQVVSEEPEPRQTAAYQAVTQEAVSISREEIEHYHLGVRYIADVCNRAATIDNAGFSKLDAGVGHSLAKQNRLTARQGVLAKRLCNKYRRQLEGLIPITK